jgi:hypothetical protein
MSGHLGPARPAAAFDRRRGAGGGLTNITAITCRESDTSVNSQPGEVPVHACVAGRKHQHRVGASELNVTSAAAAMTVGGRRRSLEPKQLFNSNRRKMRSTRMLSGESGGLREGQTGYCRNREPSRRIRGDFPAPGMHVGHGRRARLRPDRAPPPWII